MKTTSKNKQLQDPIYRQFMAAFRYELKHRERKVISADSGITVGYISDLLSDKAKATFDKREALSKACGYEYEDFLESGKSLLSGGQSSKPTPSLPQESKKAPAPARENDQSNKGDEVITIPKRTYDRLEDTIDRLEAKVQEQESELKNLRAWKIEMLEQKRRLQKQRDQSPILEDPAANQQEIG
jgi:molybdopterin converting factor small subunit